MNTGTLTDVSLKGCSAKRSLLTVIGQRLELLKSFKATRGGLSVAWQLLQRVVASDASPSGEHG
jgi:hypothetical protein